MSDHEQRALVFVEGGPVRCRYVVAVCSCGWHGAQHRPEEQGGHVAIWLHDWRRHLDESVKGEAR